MPRGPRRIGRLLRRTEESLLRRLPISNESFGKPIAGAILDHVLDQDLVLDLPGKITLIRAFRSYRSTLPSHRPVLAFSSTRPLANRLRVLLA